LNFANFEEAVRTFCQIIKELDLFIFSICFDHFYDDTNLK
jgi:hypothetical protein